MQLPFQRQQRVRRAAPAFAVALLFALLVSRSRGAEPADDPVVVTVGKQALRASEVERRLRQLPPFQRQALGKSAAEIRRRFLETVLVPELLFSAAATERALEGAPWLRSRINESYRRVLHEQLREELLSRDAVTDSDVRAYYDEHKDQFERPERIQIWRIIVDDEELARRIIDTARGTGGPDRWKELAREHSLDQATRMRGGSLGFVHEDGRTDTPQVRVDPVLFAAAKGIRDGEIAPKPIREGERFAVVWRRGSIAPVSQPLEQVKPAIEQILLRTKVKRALEELLESLRKKHVTEFHPDALEQLPDDGDTPPRPASNSAGVAPQGSADPTPRPGPAGQR